MTRLTAFSLILLFVTSAELAWSQTTHRFLPTDDAFVRSNRPTRVYGGTFELRVRRSSSADFNTYLKFNVSGLSAPVQRATLRLKVIDGSAAGGEVYSVSNNFAGTATPWQEGSLNFDNAPPLSGAPLDVVGPVTLNQTVEFDVTAAVTGNGTVSFALSNEISDLANYSSKEGVTPPELVVVTGGTGGSAPVVSGFTPTRGGVGTEVTVVGANLSGANSVRFGGVNAATFVVDSDTQLRAVVPSGASTGRIQVGSPGGTGTSATDFVVLTGGSGATLTFEPTEDAYVRSAKPTTNYGTHDDLRLRKPRGDRVLSYLKFNVTGVNGPITRATLRLFVLDAGEDGGAVFATSNAFAGSTTPWRERQLTYDNAPPLSGNPLANLGPVQLNQVVEADVTPAIRGNGEYSFAIRNRVNDLVRYSSRQGVQPPELVLEIGGSPPADPPTITGFAPTSGPVGTEVTIVGTNFTGVAAVRFGGQAAGTFFVDSGSQIRAIVPSGAVTGTLDVVADGGTATSAQSFVVVGGPKITAFTPTRGSVGTEVTIVGSNLGGITAVTFGGQPSGTFFVDSASQLRAVVPAGAATGPISVSGRSGTAVSSQSFVVLGAPTITAFTPTRGTVGTEVTVSGGNFTGVTAVAFNGTAATSFAVDSATRLRAVVPDGATTGPITVTNANGTATSSGNFEVTQPPASGSTLVLNPTDDSFVRSNRPTMVYGSADRVRVRTTNSAEYTTFLKFRVTGTGGAVAKATLRLLVVDAGDDGGSVLVAGNDWDEDTLVYGNRPGIFGSAIARVGAVTLGEVVEIDVTRAVSGDGVVTFALRNRSSDVVSYSSKEGGQAPELVIELARVDPRPFVTSFTPTSGLAGTEVTIEGGNFNGVSAVTFNGLPAAGFSVDSPTRLRATVPAGAGSGPIRVTTSQGTGVSSENFVIVQVPTISSFTPTSGPSGTEVTLVGTGFLGVTVVAFNGSPAGGFTVDSDTQLRAAVPAGAGTGPIRVSNAAGTATTLNAFTVTQPTGPETLTFRPTEDAFVRSNRPTRNYGHTLYVRVRSTPSADYVSYFKFEVSGLSGAVQSAVLKLYVLDAGPDGGSVFSASNRFKGSNRAWNEEELVWNNAPEITGRALSTAGRVQVGQVVELDVTAAISGNGTYSFAIRNNSTDLCTYSSREGQRPPELVVRTGQPPSLNPTITSFSPNSGGVGTEVTVFGSNFNAVGGGLNGNRTVRIMPLGNSITQGVHGATDDAGYRNDLAELLDAQGIDYDFVGSRRNGRGFDRDHEGHSGFRADELLAELGGYLRRNPPNLILLHIGTNDISELQSPQSTADEIGQIVDEIRRFDADIVTILASVVPRRDGKDRETSRLNSRIRTLVAAKQAAGYNLRYAAMNEAFKRNSNWKNAYLDDNVHPNDTGYALMAGVWFDAITAVLAGTSGLEVAFNGVAATSVVVDSDSRLRAVVPQGATTGRITVTNFFGTGSSAGDFVVAGGVSSLALANPVGGESWTLGSTHTVLWNASDAVENVNLAYSTDGGRSWTRIAENVPNRGRYIWTLPDQALGETLVRVADAGSGLQVTKPVRILDAEPTGLPSLEATRKAILGEVSAPEVLTTGDLDQNGRVDLIDVLNLIDLNVDYGRVAFKRPEEKEKRAQASVSLGAAKAVGDDSVAVPILIESDVAIRGFQLELEFNGAQEPLDGALALESDVPLLLYSHVAGTRLRILAYLKKENSALEPRGDLVRIVLHKNAFDPERADLRITRALLASRNHWPIEALLPKTAPEASAIPGEFRLSQNYPNPFNIETRIAFSLPQKSRVTLEIYNLRGELVRTLLNEEREPGQYRVTWDGRNRRGQVVASGIYVYRMKAGAWEASRRLVLVK